MDCFPSNQVRRATTVCRIANTDLPGDPPLESDAVKRHDREAARRTSHRDYLAMHSPQLRLRLATLNRLTAGLLILLPLSAGCCHMPTINANANVCADGHLVNEVVTPGNAGPVHPFAVPPYGNCGPTIAVIDVDGVLLNMDMVGPGSAGENPMSLFSERLAAAANDPCTRAVIVRINSYGGSVYATDTMRHELEMFKSRTHIPVVACILDTGAGGAYYIATAADQIVASRNSIVGGIGVILNLYNMTETFKKNGLLPAPIKAGENINAGMILNEDDKNLDNQTAMLTAYANQFHQEFKDAVLRSRPNVNPAQDEIFDGRIFTGIQAAQLRLIDTLGYFDDAVVTARGLAGLGDDAKIVFWRRCNDRARSVYSVTPNVPIQSNAFPINYPGFDRAQLPTFLYLWEPEPTMEKLGGR
jgi:protease-4